MSEQQEVHICKNCAHKLQAWGTPLDCSRCAKHLRAEATERYVVTGEKGNYDDYQYCTQVRGVWDNKPVKTCKDYESRKKRRHWWKFWRRR